MAYIVHETTRETDFSYHSPGVSGRVLLSRDPVGDTEAVTKKYVDDSISRHLTNGSHLSSGQKLFLDGLTINTAELGYISNVNSNIKDLLLSKVSLSGSEISGEILSSLAPSDDNDSVTKQYVDNYDLGYPPHAVGHMYTDTSSTPKPSYLLCDGSLKQKTAYSNLYTYAVGNTYATKNVNGSVINSTKNITINKEVQVPRTVTTYTVSTYVCANINCACFYIDPTLWNNATTEARAYIESYPHESIARYSGQSGESNSSPNFQYFDGDIGMESTPLHTLVDGGYNFPRLIKRTNGTPVLIVFCGGWNWDDGGRCWMWEHLINLGLYPRYYTSGVTTQSSHTKFNCYIKNSTPTYTTVYDTVIQSTTETITTATMVFTETDTNTDATLFRLPNIPPYQKGGVLLNTFIKY